MASASPVWKAAGQRCSTFAACIRDRLRAFNTIARSSPWIILGVPFLTFLVLAAAGIIAVALSARGAAQHSRDEALSLARAAASQFGQQLAFASSAVEVLAAVVRANPSYDRASSRFNTTAPALLDTAPTGSISSLRVLPSGRLRLVYPTTEAVSDMLGFDALAYTDPALGDMYSEDLAFVGPLPPLPGREAEGPLLLVRRAIFVPLPADLSNNFGRPDLPNPSCGDLCAYNQTRGTVFWGLVVCEVLVRALDSSSAAALQQSHPHPLPTKTLATPAVSALRALGGVGYAYRLTAGNGVVVTASGDEAPREPVTASLALPGSEWQLQVWRQSGSWKPGWFGGALAAAILLAAAAALLLCRMLVSRRRHAMLLEALLPRDLLKELSATHAETMGRAGPLDAAASPAGLLLELLGSLLAGSPPDLRQVVLLRSLVLRQAEWYHPLGVAQAIKGAQLESDVARALMRQLGTGSGTDSVSSRPDFWKADDGDVDVNDGDGEYDGVESDPMERRQRCSAAGGGRAGGGWQGAGGGGVGGVDSDAGDPAQQQQQEQLGTLRGALAFVLSPAAQALPMPLAAASRAGPLHLGSNSDRAAAATGGAASSSTGRRRRRRSSLLGLQAGGGGSAGPGMTPLQQPSAPLMSAAAMQAISAADIDAVTLDLASAAVELLETTEDLELAASGALRSYPVLMPPVGLPGLQQQPSQPQQLQSQAAPGTPALLLQSCDSMSFAGLVLHRTDSSQQQQQARRGGLGSGWRPKPAASASSYHHVLGGFGDAGSAASAGSSSQLVMNAATAILVGRQQAPHSAASNSGSPRAQPALPRQPQQQPQQAQQARRAQTPTYPSLLPPPPAAAAQSPVPSGAAAGPAASAGSRLLHSLQQHRVPRQPQQDAPQHASATIAGGDTVHLTATSTGRAAAAQDAAAPAADGGGSDRACQGGVDAACEAHRRPQQHAGHGDPRTGEEDGSNHSRAARRSSNRRHGSEAAAAASMRRFTAREEGEEEVEAAGMDGLLEEGEASRAGVHRAAASSRAVAGGAIVPPPAALLDQVEVLLAGSGEWQYDTWALAEASGGHALSVMGFYLMQREGLVAAFRIQPVKLARLLRALEDGYPADNPYHNATHAADVLRTLSVLLRGARLTAHYAHGLGLLASYFAAIIHDHGHPGLTGDFLVATSHPLALRYNDRSPLESHHAASAFTLLAERPDLDAFAELPKEQRTAFRKQVVDMVLATDMKQHFSLLTQFTALHKARKAGLNGDGGGHGANGKGLTPPATTAGGGGTTSNDSSTQRQQQQQGPQQTLRSQAAATRAGGAITSAASNVAPAADPPAASNTSSSLQQQASQPQASLEPAPSPQDDAERSLTLQIALKAADIGHLAAALPVHCRWLGVLEEEFFRQGDKEKELGIPISPLFDRAKQGVSKSQVGFFDFVALPLVRALTDGFPGASPLAACFERNYTHWKTVEAEAAAQQAAAQQAAQQAAAQQPRQRGE